MFRTLVLIIILIVVASLANWFSQLSTVGETSEEKEETLAVDPQNATYIIEGNEFTLTGGKAEKEIVPGAASKIRINVFDAWSTKGDVNGDGLEDTVVLLTYNAGGSGTFYYVALALQKKQGYQGTNAVFIGDRIAPQVSEIKEGEIIINYADRYPWENFAARPSVGKSKYLFCENGELKEKQRETLSRETALNLAKEKWGDCISDICEELTVSVLDGKDGVWFVQAIYDGLKDDSVKAKKRINWAYYIEGSWQLEALVVDEQKCQLGRGHQDFSNEICL
ncbi:MAG: hypothetical protein ABIG08_03565 [bacterium]